MSEREAWLDKLQFLSDAMESASQPFAAGSPGGSLLIFNEAYCKLTGYTREEITGVNWANTLTAPESRRHELEILKQFNITRQPQRYEENYVRKDGSIVPVEMFMHVAVDSRGETIFYYAFITDISERKRSEESLRRSHTLLAEAEKMSHTGAWEWDLILNQWTFSDEWLSIHGCRNRTPSQEGLLRTAYPDDRAKISLALDDARRGVSPYSIEHRIIRQDTGEMRIIKSCGETVRDARGTPVKIRGVARDITERKRMDEELRKANRAYMVMAKGKDAMIHAEDELSLLEKVCRIIINIGGYRLAWIGYVENDAMRTVRPVARAGYDDGYVDNLRIALEDPVYSNGPTGISLKTGKPYVTRNVRTDQEMAPWREEALKRGYMSTLNLPIIYEKQIIGSLVIYSGSPESFDEQEQTLLFEFAGNLAYGIASIRDRKRRIRAEKKLLLANQELETQIEERTKAEEALRESEERFTYALKAAREGIWDWDLETNHVYYSPRYKEMLGYSEDEIESHASAWVRLVHPDDRERALQVVDAVIHGEREYEMEFRMLHKDGHYLDILSRGYPIRRGAGGPVTRIVGTHMDITERKQIAEELRRTRDELEVRVRERTTELQRSNDELNAQIEERKQIEGAMRESEERFRALADNIPNLAWMADPDGWIFWYNKQWYDYTGTTLEEMQGWGWQRVHHPDYVQKVTEEWQGKIMSGQPYDNIFPLRGKDGNYRWFLTRITPIRDESGRIRRWFGTNTDISERKWAEEALSEAKARAELYVDLMGHDINNMNQSAMGYLELALEMLEADGKIKLDGKVLIEKPLQAIKSSSTLIDNVRKLQRMMTEGVKTRPVDLHDLFEELKMHDFLTSDRDVTVNFENIPHYLAVGNELLQDVFYNLINNAVKHSRPDQPVTVDVRVERTNENGLVYYRCCIEDNGPGIPDELKPRLFHRFQRGKTKAHGKGLGLYIVRMLVNGYHGKVWVEDRVPGDYHKGAKFVVLLPAEDK